MAILAALRAKELRQKSPLLDNHQALSQAMREVLEGKVKSTRAERVAKRVPEKAKAPPKERVHREGKKPSPPPLKKEKKKKKKEKKRKEKKTKK